jgi:mannose-6-phosphate isomerase-like protein (cupin superfamily)
MRTSLILIFLVATGLVLLRSSEGTGAASSSIVERPLIIGQDQGETRVRRSRPGQNPAMGRTSFTIKIDQSNGGSPDFWFATETMPPGAEIKYHRHLHEDEILYIGSGIAHVHVGNLEGDARAGGIVFIPRNTWIDVKNVGTTPIHLLFGFNSQEFDRYMRCSSVPNGRPAPPLSMGDWKRCEQVGDVQHR